MSAHAGDERLGPYRLQERLGEGGMGVVYLATAADGQLVAVKVLRQGVPAEATARSRLAREVDTMRRVHSPHVAEVVDAGLEDDPPYIVTRYVAGRTLEDVVTAEGPLSGVPLANLANGLAAALVAIHSAGVVHRDLKPANVMLVDGQPVVIDFGIAQAADSTRLTMTGMFMGTPGYLAPEIIQGKLSGPGADVHSWGATVAYAATGRPPFGGGQFEAIFYRIVNGSPDLYRMPRVLLPLVLAALARDPDSRPSATELADSLSAIDPAALVPPPATAVAETSAAADGIAAVAEPMLPVPAAPDGQAVPAQAVPGAGPALPAHDLAARAQAGSPVLAAPPAVKPSTMPISVPAHDDFADLLPPVRYERPGAGQLVAGNGAVLGSPGPWSSNGSAAALPEQLAGGREGWRPGPASTAKPGSRLPLVLATLAALVAISILMPVAGAAAALIVLMCLRATDVTSDWVSQRRSRQGMRSSDPAAAVAFYPWALFRSVLRFVLLSPVALLFAAAIVVIAALAAGTESLPRSASYAVGAFVACYCIGPGSASCRRPLDKLYSRVTRSVPAAVVGAIALVAVAVAAAVAAATHSPGFWPDGHLGHQLHSASFTHPTLKHFPGNIGTLGRNFWHWLGHHL